MHEVTRILSAIEQGDPQAAEQLLPFVYGQLRRLAAEKLAQEKPGQTLQATALVHEVYIRLADVEKAEHWNGRGHFFAAAAEAMRRILVERARRHAQERHGGGWQRLELSLSEIPAPDGPVEFLALDAALERLAEVDAQSAEVVKLRYFAGLTAPQVAVVIGVSPRQVGFLWSYARSWLRREVHGQ
jgi:RNA polymerase sigma factor (TIGR02999 family)